MPQRICHRDNRIRLQQARVNTLIKTVSHPKLDSFFFVAALEGSVCAGLTSVITQAFFEWFIVRVGNI